MECFNTLLLKLREVHEREVEGKWKFEDSSREREGERERAAAEMISVS